MESPVAAMALPHHEQPQQPPAPLRHHSATMEAVEDVVYGSVAGIVGKYIEYPFDTVKVRLQSQPDNLPLRYKGPIDCFRQSIKADGVLGLYRGITAPLVGAAAETSSLFFFERLGREAVYLSGVTARDQDLSLPALFITGAFSGFFTSYVLTPIELVKCKIQAPMQGAGASAIASVEGSGPKTTPTQQRPPPPPPPPLKPLGVIRDIYRHHGVRGFWHGQLGTLIRESGGSAAWFGSKETVTKMFRALNAKAAPTPAEKDRLAAEALPLWQQALAGASAGVAYNFLFFPADTIKSRLQTMAIGDSVKDRTFWKEGTLIWRRYGLAGLYRGCGITCLRSAPSSAFIFMVFDGLKQHLPMQ